MHSRTAETLQGIQHTCHVDVQLDRRMIAPRALRPAVTRTPASSVPGLISHHPTLGAKADALGADGGNRFSPPQSPAAGAPSCPHPPLGWHHTRTLQ